MSDTNDELDDELGPPPPLVRSNATNIELTDDEKNKYIRIEKEAAEEKRIKAAEEEANINKQNGGRQNRKSRKSRRRSRSRRSKRRRSKSRRSRRTRRHRH